ncbi:MAG: VOC family protein [Nocardioides sp.]|uniref:VOC family protein n=1 Tax=Nocardioides nematodiphilus TaxID=2849669 RepID=UPI001CD9E548|nr:VOC family protein [Nocardioides nematodiphilus]MCA1981600.1 VOC family protein [Nocardioides nematodiphilus]
MRLDHLSYAAGPDGLVSTAKRLGELLGQDFVDGGVHPRFGTRNMTLPLRGGIYLEVVEALEHPASDKAPFGQAVKARSALGGGWMGWVVSTGDMASVEERLGRPWVDGNRHLPDGTELLWKQIGINGLIADPQLPYFIHWITRDLHPGNAGSDVTLRSIEISGEQQRVREYMGADFKERTDPWTGRPAEDVELVWVAEHGTPGLLAAQFSTPLGDVRI